VRRIIIELKKKTRNEDTELRILTHLPKDKADGLTIAHIYNKR